MSSLRPLGLPFFLLIAVEGCTDSEVSASPTSLDGGIGGRDAAQPGVPDSASGRGGGGSPGKVDGGGGRGGALPGQPDGGGGRGGGLPSQHDSGGGAGGATPPTRIWDAAGPTTLDAACDRWADALCKRLERCALYNLRLNYGDAATCIARNAADCKVEIATPGTGTTASSLNRCANYAQGADCFDLDAPACAPQAGQRTEGAACLYASQCAGRHCERSIPLALCGTCTSQPGLGEACTRTCDYGLECLNGTCVRTPLLGMACNAQLECAGTLRCVEPGVCAPTLGAGEPCLPYNLYECNLSQGLECNSDSKVCAPYNELAGPGEPCGAATATFPRTGCLAGGSCPTTVNDAGLRTCLPRIEIGEPCGSSAPPNAGCAAPARCTNGVCAMRDPTDCQ